MNICFSVDDSLYRWGGVQYNVLTLAKWCASQGHKVTILHSENPSVKAYPLPEGIEAISIARGFDIKGLNFNGSVSPFPGFARKNDVKRILEEKQFDCIYFNYPFSPFISGIIVKIAKKLKKQKKIHTKLVATVLIYVEENLIPRLGNKALALINRKAINSFDVITHCSDAAKEYVDNYLKKPSVYVPLSTEDNKGKSESETKKDILSILFFGRFEVRKGIIDFIEAIQKLPSELKDQANFVIAGGGGILLEEAQNLVKLYNLPINFKIKLSDAEKEACFRKADLTVFPAKYGESFGIVLVEAMSYGCAVLGYANAGYAFTLSEFKDETLVAVNDIEGLSKKIAEHIQNNNASRKLGNKLYTYFKQTYSVDVVANKMLALGKSS